MGKRLSKTKLLDAAIGLVITNLDLLFEIFLHIPAKSLIRFKLVSKIWLSLISDPNFAFAHTSRNTIKSPTDLCYKSFKGESFIPLNEMSIFPSTTCLGLMRQKYVPNFRISHSCNGLIVIEQIHFDHPLVFNPTTQKYRLLVIPSDYYRIIVDHIFKWSSWDYLLAYEPLESQHYKLVLLCTSVAFIFSSQSGSWNEFPITATSHKCCTRKIYCNRAIHWLTEDNFHVQLDVDAVELTEISLPSKPRILGYDNIVYFGESDGRLLLIQCHRFGAPGFRILEMDTNTHRWAVKHQVNLRPLVSEFPELQPKPSVQSFRYSVLYVKSGADKKSYSLVIATNKKVVMYDVKKGKRSTKILCNCSTFLIDNGLSEYAQTLIPSLAPV